MSRAMVRIELEIDPSLLARLDRIAVFAKQFGLADLSQGDMITDAIERYVFGAEMAAPGLTAMPLDPNDY